MRKSLLVVVVFAFCLAACDWPMIGGGAGLAGFNKRETKITAANVSALAPLWSAPVAGTGAASQPVVVGDVVYVGEPNGSLYAFAANAGATCTSGVPMTCERLWAAPTGAPITTAPAVDNGVVYVISGQTLFAFDASGTTCGGVPKTCEPLWTAALGITPAAPVVSAGRVYVAAGGSSVLEVFDAGGVTNCSEVVPVTCQPLWTAGYGPPTPDGVSASPAVVDNEVFIGLQVFDANGVQQCSGTPTTCLPLWTNIAGDPHPSGPPCFHQVVDAVSAPAISAGRVFYTVACIDTSLMTHGTVEAFDATQQTNCAFSGCLPLWIGIDAPGGAAPAVAGGVVYQAYSADLFVPPSGSQHVGGFLAYDAVPGSGCLQQCAPIWSAATESRRQPSVAGGVVYVASDKLRAFDAAGTMGCSGTPKTCSPLRALKFAGPDASVTIANGVVYVSDVEGLHAYTTP